MNDFEIKFNKFLQFIHDNYSEVQCEIYNKYIEKENEKAFIRLVPEDYDITEIPRFKKYCRIIGLECDNIFLRDETRRNCYRDYHECEIINDGTFLKNKLLEDLQ